MGIPPPAPRQALPAMGWEEGGLPGGQGRPLPGRGETPQGILRPKRKEKSRPACGSRVGCALWFSTRVQLVHTEHPQVLMRPPPRPCLCHTCPKCSPPRWPGHIPGGAACSQGSRMLPQPLPSRPRAPVPHLRMLHASQCDPILRTIGEVSGDFGGSS